MKLIREVAKKAIETGYLSIEAEDRLRQMLRSKYDREDFEAFVHLQKAAMDGRVKQESRELMIL